MKRLDAKLFLFDVDGVLLTGLLEWETRVIGGYRLFSELRRRGIPFGLLGSGSNWSTNEAWILLRSLGFLVDRNQVWLAARVAAEYLKEKHGSVRCLVVGEEGLVKELRNNGHKVVKSWEKTDAVVVGHDRFLSFGKLNQAIRAINNKKAEFIAVNKVRWYYSPFRGPYVSPGAIVNMLEYQTGREAFVVGKPSIIHYSTVLKNFGVKPDEAVMVGDSPDVDVKPAKSIGMKTVLVTSVKRWENPRTDTEADIVVKNVDELVEML
ncbi:MAG: HAD-IIA family hydrolase [Candidatus Caldarchaeum sp.]|nr:HAD-IIA family hydrolase [Candidatus Caldarchaeum sp.]